MANKRLDALRHSRALSAAIVAELLPNHRQRMRALTILANGIRRAHQIAPASWCVTLFDDAVHLNVGRGAVLQLLRGEILLIVTAKLLKVAPQSSRRVFQHNANYRFVPDAVEGRVRTDDLERYGGLETAHADLIERAANNRKICFWWRAHSPAILRVMREVHLDVPSPDYAVQSHASRKTLHDVDDLDRDTVEGRRGLHTHLVTERDRMLVTRKKQSVLKTDGCLRCEVCAFDFCETYGGIGYGFAEVHHLAPLGTSGKRRTKLIDLAVVCSNCHRMLHKGDPLFTVRDLRTRLKSHGETRRSKR